MTLIEILEARKEVLDVHEMAELLKVSERHIYELVADGSLPAFRVGKVIRFDPQDVADWLRRKKPSDKRDSQRKPQKHENAEADRGRETSNPPVHVWRNRAKSFEVALITNTSAAASDSVENS